MTAILQRRPHIGPPPGSQVDVAGTQDCHDLGDPLPDTPLHPRRLTGSYETAARTLTPSPRHCCRASLGDLDAAQSLMGWQTARAHGSTAIESLLLQSIERLRPAQTSQKLPRTADKSKIENLDSCSASAQEAFDRLRRISIRKHRTRRDRATPSPGGGARADAHHRELLTGRTSRCRRPHHLRHRRQDRLGGLGSVIRRRDSSVR